MGDFEITDILLLLAALVIISAVLAGSYFGVSGAIREVENYKEYKSFCENNLDFCYCEYLGCTFRLTFINGEPDNNTKEYCKIAIKQNDKQGIFDGRCNG